MTTSPSDIAAAAERAGELLKALGPDHALAAEARLARDRERQREKRRRQTPEQIEDERERQRKARARKPPRPFLAIDGEGGGTDALGRQLYLTMVAADAFGEEERIVHRNGEALTTPDCLDFLLGLPPTSKAILVAYGLGYDATQILRRMPPRKLREVINPRQGKNGPIPVFWRDYAITYQQGQYLRIARIDRSGPKPKVLKGSSRTVYETLGFFQSTFIKAITDWNTGTEAERAIIAANKEIRDQFTMLTPEMIEYCTLECRHLAMLMTEFREVCYAAGIRPERWAGAGWLATAMLKQHGALKRPLTAREKAEAAERKPSRNSRPSARRRPERDREFDAAANLAYYGGRFEISRIGFIPGPVYAYDIKSAYPAAMLQMPCPLHTRWKHSRRRRLPANGELYLAKVTFAHPAGSVWCGFPFRQNGGLFWPFCGTGWYWSVEIEAARQHLRADILRVHDVWIAERCCDCSPPYEWISELFAERQRLGESTKGYPIKLGLNSLYGKRAQRSGRGPYHDAVEAGLITAITRAQIIAAVAQDPGAVVMVATDAIFSTRPLKLDVGKGLGQWEEKLWPDLFIAQPGVYFSPAKLQSNTTAAAVEGVKSRGVKRSVIGKAAPQFLRTFEEWIELLHRPGALELALSEPRQIPSVPVTVRLFYGNRLALARGKPYLAGRWSDETRHETFEWDTKRDRTRVVLNDRSLTTFPRTLSPFDESEGYKPADFDKPITIMNDAGGLEEMDEDVWLEGMPDHIDFLPHEE
jgi:hypothetical protein